MSGGFSKIEVRRSPVPRGAIQGNGRSDGRMRAMPGPAGPAKNGGDVALPGARLRAGVQPLGDSVGCRAGLGLSGKAFQDPRPLRCQP